MSDIKSTLRKLEHRLVLAPLQLILSNVAVNHNIASAIKTAEECAEYIM